MSEEATRSGLSFKQDGFVIVRDFLDPSELAEVDAQLSRFIREVAPRAKKEHVVYEDQSKTAIRHLSGLHQYDDFWKVLLVRPKTIEFVEACVGSAVEPSHSELFFKAALVGTAAPVHQDNAYMHYKPADGAAVWVALDEVTLENGCILYAKGSQKLGDLPHVRGESPPFSKRLASALDPAAYPEIPAIMKAGDAVIHHILTVHRSGPNHTSYNRRGLVFDYKGIHAREDTQAHELHMKYVQQLHQNRADQP